MCKNPADEDLWPEEKVQVLKVVQERAEMQTQVCFVDCSTFLNEAWVAWWVCVFVCVSLYPSHGANGVWSAGEKEKHGSAALSGVNNSD